MKPGLSPLGVQISVPGKAFLIGEYLALQGGPCVLATVEPRFVLRAVPASTRAPSPFHPESPAGRLWRQSIGQNWQAEFHDPHHGGGGWGGSTAEYLTVQALVAHESGVSNAPWQNWEQYRAMTAGKSKPSGADLLAQEAGGLVQVSTGERTLHSSAWPFSDVGFLLVKTPVKVRTHEHLATLQSDSQAVVMDKLGPGTADAIAGLAKRESSQWIQGIQHFAQGLADLGFVAPSTQSLLQGVPKGAALAAKGCGALGADVVVAFYDKNQASAPEILSRYFVLQQCSVVGNEKSLSKGLQKQILPAGDQS